MYKALKINYRRGDVHAIKVVEKTNIIIVGQSMCSDLNYRDIGNSFKDFPPYCMPNQSDALRGSRHHNNLTTV